MSANRIFNRELANESAIIARDVYCPYCESNDAFLISEVIGSRNLLRLPEVGCKAALLMGCTFGCYALVKGYPLVELKNDVEHRTYGFCPHCGNVYSAEAAKQNNDDNNRY